MYGNALVLVSLAFTCGVLVDNGTAALDLHDVIPIRELSSKSGKKNSIMKKSKDSKLKTRKHSKSSWDDAEELRESKSGEKLSKKGLSKEKLNYKPHHYHGKSKSKSASEKSHYHHSKSESKSKSKSSKKSKSSSKKSKKKSKERTYDFTIRPTVDITFCLDLPHSNDTNATSFPLIMRPCDGYESQRWKIDNEGRIHTPSDPQLCLKPGLPSPSDEDAIPVEVGSCPPEGHHPFQYWVLTSEEEIRLKWDTKKCMELAEATHAENQTVVLSNCTGGDVQKWKWILYSDASYFSATF